MRTAATSAIRGLIRLPSNTTLIGADGNAGIVNGHIVLSSVSQVIIRNLKIVNPCDVGPVWDPNDGALGNWNAVTTASASRLGPHMVDHVTFTDGAMTDDLLPVENGHFKQCHDGALDITNASDYVTVSYNVFGQHRKNNLIGSSDTATADSGKLHITFSNNVFRDIVSRAPRVRYGQVHLYNNYFVGSKTHPAYPYEYSVGVGQQAQILSNNNVFEIAGATRCDEVVTPIGGTVPGAFRDSGSALNGAALAGRSTPGSVAYSVPYAYSARPLALVKANAVAQAGVGKLTSTISGSGNVTPDTTVTLTCPASGLYFCDDFQNSSMANWTLLPVSGPNGSFSVKAESIGASNIVMQYTAASTGGVLATLKPAAMSGVPSGDYFVEARIKPMTNSTTSNKLLYLLTRYKDASNWYGAGLNVQSATTSTQVEIARMLAGTLTRPKQVKKPIQMDAQFYTVRFEMKGATLTVYLDGEALGPSPTPVSRNAGWWACTPPTNRSRSTTCALAIPRQAFAADAQSFFAELCGGSGRCAAGGQRHCRQAGWHAGWLQRDLQQSGGSGSGYQRHGAERDAGGRRHRHHYCHQRFRSDPGAHYCGHHQPAVRAAGANLRPVRGHLPAAHADAVHIDASLKLTFDGPPALGTGGSIRIFRKADNALVDVIRLSGETDTLGYAGQANLRKVNTTPVSISGNTAIIKPHANKLAYGVEYYVAISNGVFTGASLGGVPFTGIGELGDWSFTTRADAPSPSASLTVGDAADTDFATVQGALNFAMQTLGAADPVTIHVRNGVYNELLYLRGKDNVTLLSESRDGAVIQYTNYDTLNTGSGASQASADAAAAGGRAVMLVEASDMLVLDTLTLRNTTLRSAAISAQAETLYFNNDSGRMIARNANFYSEQDTLNLKGYAWFWNALVAGNVDFIWGSAAPRCLRSARSARSATPATPPAAATSCRHARPTPATRVMCSSTAA
jgi:pectate lyase